jgi:CDP-diacylglycerol--serine O-phosphatidyltransferase
MASMFCGYYSIILSATGFGSEHVGNRFETAAWLIIAAAVLDALDGKLARFTGTSSEFGVQYDSLADVISFGLAPSVLVYYTFFHNWGTLGLLASFTPLVFGSIRLARFNVQLKGFDKDYFRGLPIPAAATTICTFILFNLEIWGYLRWSKVFFAMILVLGLLMISNFRYEVMPDFSKNGSTANRIKIFLLIAGGILIVLYPNYIFFPIAVLYVLSGIFSSIANPIPTEKNQNSENKGRKK